MESKLESYFKSVLLYEDSELQEKAREVMPIQELNEGARKRLATINNDRSDQKPLDFQDCLLRELQKWYSSKFFSWFDSPTCPSCQKKMTIAGCLRPTEDDLKWGATSIEGYACKDCRTTERFPRYNHPGKLLETRRGRCGEWSNCFTFLCRALGMDARLIIDFTDHVWTEVFSESQGRWQDNDCRERVDQPMVYEESWGKKLTYIFAFSKDEVVDVTWRYTRKKEEVLKRRNMCSEQWLESTLVEMNKKRQETFPLERRNFLEKRLKAELAEFAELHREIPS